MCLLIVLTARLLVFRDTEPSEFGHPLSYWVEQIDVGPSTESFLPAQRDGPKNAANAIAGLGTNALPWLIKWIRYKESPWRTKVADLAEKIPLELVQDYAESHIRRPRAAARARGAAKSIGMLGERAARAVPELARLVNEGAPDMAVVAAYALGPLGTNSLPVLLGVIRNREHPCRRDCIIALSFMPGVTNVSSEVVPVLAECVTDTTNAGVAELAVLVLGDLKGEPSISVPALVTGLKSTDSSVRKSSAEALMWFGRKALIAIPALTNALSDGSSDVRVSAGYALRQIAPEQFRDLEVEGDKRTLDKH